jgi:predicted DNA-binding protein
MRTMSIKTTTNGKELYTGSFLSADEKEKLESLAKNYDISQSEFIRILINTYYEEFKSNIGGKANV